MATEDDISVDTPPPKRKRIETSESTRSHSPDTASGRGSARHKDGPPRRMTRSSARGDGHFSQTGEDSSPAPLPPLRRNRRRRAASASSSGASTPSATSSPRRPSRRREASRSPSPSATPKSSFSTDGRTRTQSLSPSRSTKNKQHQKQTPEALQTPPQPLPQPPQEPPPRPNYKPRLVLHGHTGPVSQVRISPDGRFIASSSADATLKIWDATSGQHMDTLVGHMAGVSCVAWAPDSDTLASGSDDKAIRLWDRVTGQPKLTARKSLMLAGSSRGSGRSGSAMAPLRGHHNYVHCLAFSPKGNILASGSYDEAVFLWDVRAGRLMRSLPAHSDPVSGIDFSPDGTLVASCSTDGLIRIWDSSTGQCLRTLVHEDNPAVANVCFSPNGRFVLAFNLDNCIRLWDYVAGQVKKTYQGHRNEKFAVGGCFGVLSGKGTGTATTPFVASASEDGDIVLWDVVAKTVLQRVRGHAEGVCFWVDVVGETIVSAGQDHTVRVYRHVSGGDDDNDGRDGGDESAEATREERLVGNGGGETAIGEVLEELPFRREEVKAGAEHD